MDAPVGIDRACVVGEFRRRNAHVEQHAIHSIHAGKLEARGGNPALPVAGSMRGNAAFTCCESSNTLLHQRSFQPNAFSKCVISGAAPGKRYTLTMSNRTCGIDSPGSCRTYWRTRRRSTLRL